MLRRLFPRDRVRAKTYDGLEAGYRYERRTPLPETSWSQFPGVELDDGPSYEELVDQVETLTSIVNVHADTFRAARHLMEVLGMVSSAGAPVFRLNDEAHEGENLAIICHAVMDLQVTLDGTPAPQFILDARSLQ